MSIPFVPLGPVPESGGGTTGDDLDIDGYTLEEAMRLLLSINGGKVAATTTSAVFRAADDSKVRVTATTDSSGNRTTVAMDAS